MIGAVIIRTFPAADRKGRRGSEQGATCSFPAPRLATRTKASLSAAAADLRLIYPTCGHFGARETSVNESALGCGRALTRTGKTVAIIFAPNANPVRRNSVGGMAPRCQLPFLGKARFQLRQKPCCCRAERLQTKNSFHHQQRSRRHLTIGASACVTADGSDLTQLRATK